MVRTPFRFLYTGERERNVGVNRIVVLAARKLFRRLYRETMRLRCLAGSGSTNIGLALDDRSCRPRLYYLAIM